MDPGEKKPGWKDKRTSLVTHMVKVLCHGWSGKQGNSMFTPAEWVWVPPPHSYLCLSLNVQYQTLIPLSTVPSFLLQAASAVFPPFQGLIHRTDLYPWDTMIDFWTPDQRGISCSWSILPWIKSHKASIFLVGNVIFHCGCTPCPPGHSCLVGSQKKVSLTQRQALPYLTDACLTALKSPLERKEFSSRTLEMPQPAVTT